MGMYLLIAFIAIPLVEIGVFIQVGGIIGVVPTLAIIVITAFTGAYMVRSQGLATTRSAQATLSRGQVPLAEVFDGVCLFASGLLLITPGFVTDGVGGVFLVPWLRRWLRGVLIRRLLDTGSGPDDGGGDRKDRVIDGEFREIDPPSDRADDDPK